MASFSLFGVRMNERVSSHRDTDFHGDRDVVDDVEDRKTTLFGGHSSGITNKKKASELPARI